MSGTATHNPFSHGTHTLRRGGAVGVRSLRGDKQNDARNAKSAGEVAGARVVAYEQLDRALFVCDELAGFLTACALVKPTKSIMDVEARSVLKKMKDKAFARTVSREDMAEGARLPGIGLEEHVGDCLGAMQARAGEMGLSAV